MQNDNNWQIYAFVIKLYYEKGSIRSGGATRPKTGKYNHVFVHVNPLNTRVQVKLAERYVKHQKLKDANELYALFFFKEEIGQGAFGRVIEVTEKNTLKVWAMKIVTKAKVHVPQVQWGKNLTRVFSWRSGRSCSRK